MKSGNCERGELWGEERCEGEWEKRVENCEERIAGRGGKEWNELRRKMWCIEGVEKEGG